MKKFVGHRIRVLLSGAASKVEGEMVGDRRDMILLKDDEGVINRIIKSHIAVFTPVGSEPVEKTVLVLRCSNASEGCPGVQFVKVGDGVSRSDFETFTAGCPKRSEQCSFGSMGDVRCLDGDVLAEIMGGTLFGDFPEDGSE